MPVADSHVLVNRSGGYSGLNAFIFMMLFFCSPLFRSFRAFEEDIAAHNEHIAAIAGFRRLLSTSSLSRLLLRITQEEVDNFSSWILLDFPNILPILERPDVLHIDRAGNPWHILDMDPTCEGVRERGLPEDVDLPKGNRRNQNVAQKGYLGRKRGQKIVRRTAVFHSGAKIWVQCSVGSGKGVHSYQLEKAFQTAADLHARLNSTNTSRMLMRFDGEFGHNRTFALGQKHGISVLTRISHYNLFKDIRILERMNSGKWMVVPDSGSGPKRFALDLGIIELTSTEQRYLEEGVPIDPQKVRVVVTRHESGLARGAGKFLDGQKFELFAASNSLEAEFSASDLVFLYFGRTSQENNFLLAKKENRLKTTYCAELPGETFAQLVSLGVWNMKVARGEMLSQFTGVSPLMELENQKSHDIPPLPEQMIIKSVPTPIPTNEKIEEENVSSKSIRAQIDSAIATLPWAQILSRRKANRRWNTEENCLETSEGIRLHFKLVDRSRKKHQLRFYTRCAKRNRAGIVVENEFAAKLTELKKQESKALERELIVNRNQVRKAKANSSASKKVFEVFENRQQMYDRNILLPSFASVERRNGYDKCIRKLKIEVHLVIDTLKPVELVHTKTRFTVQNRRKTWAERALFDAIAINRRSNVLAKGEFEALRLIQANRSEANL